MYLTHAIKSRLAEPYKIPTGMGNADFLNCLLQTWVRHGKIRLGGYDPLTRLGSKYSTDKGLTIFPFHGYLEHYHRLFERFRNQEINLLEIGLARTSYRDSSRVECPSISLWLEYFPEATIYGMDIDDFTQVKLPRSHIFQGDQGSADDLERVTQQCPVFDIIIDDGSHASSHQQTSLKVLFPYLRSGGLYVIEDLNSQPERIELALPCEHKTKEVLKNRELLEKFVDGVEEVLMFDSRLENTDGEMGVIRKR